MPFRRTRRIIPVDKTGADLQVGDHGSGNLFVGIKGCPVDLFAAQVAKMPHGDWYKVNKVPECKRETTKASKESRIDTEVELEQQQQTRHRTSQDIDIDGEQEIINKENGTNGRSKTNVPQRCRRRFCAFVRMSFQRIRIKRRNKVDIVYLMTSGMITRSEWKGLAIFLCKCYCNQC